MEKVHVQLEPEGQNHIIAVFSCEQDASVYPNQETIAVDDSRWRAFWEQTIEAGRVSFPSPPQDTSRTRLRAS